MKKSFSILCILLLSMGVYSQNSHLDKRISLHQQQLSLEEVIYNIGEAGNFQFSYNSSIIEGNKNVALNVEGQLVSQVLDDLLGTGYDYKVVGNHVIILPDTKRNRIPKRDCPQNYVITGYIMDSQSGVKIFEASIYEASNRLITATDQNGFYTLNLPCSDEDRYLNFSKVGYLDTVIIVRTDVEEVMNISLHPLPADIAAMDKVKSAKYNMHHTPFVAALVPNKSVVMANNVQVVEERAAQISFLPFLGSNRFVSGMLTNRFSLNVLAGYSGGVRGLELGGLMNMDRGDVSGVQIAGIGNIVGRQTDGLQVGGFFNVTAGRMNGWQMAGFTNIAIDTIKGVQISGFANVLRGGMYGSQVSGFLNYATDLHGLQIAPFNYADTVSAGLPVGVFSFVRRGFHPIEVSTEEMFWANLSFKTGVNGFYNIFGAGYSGDMAYAGYGIGSQFYIKKKFSPGLEFHTRAIVGINNEFQYKGLQNKLQLNFTWKFHKHLSITTGPSLNGVIGTKGFPQSEELLMSSLPIKTYSLGESDIRYWFGWSFGVRL